MNDALITVEVVYASKEQQTLLEVEMPVGATVEMAIRQSGILKQFPELDLKELAVGIFSKKTTLDTPLRPGDRVEIYRPLELDPKDRRRRLAERTKR